MKIDTNEHGQIRLKEIFNAIELASKCGGSLFVSERDGNIEITDGKAVFTFGAAKDHKKLADRIINHCNKEIRDESAAELAIRLIEECLVTRKKISYDLKNLVEVQSRSENSQTNEYQRGLANGLILAQATLSGDDPVYIEKPD